MTIIQYRIGLILDAMGKGIVTADQLAGQLGCSVRTVYRYIAIMRGQGYRIAAGGGVGYLLIKGKGLS